MKAICSILLCLVGVIAFLGIINFFGLAALTNKDTEEYSEGE